MHISRISRTSTLLLAVVLAPLGGVACRSKTSAVGEGASPAASASSALESQPVPSDQVQQALNPSHQPAYSGPIGSVHGVVRVSGPSAPSLPDVVRHIPEGKCEDARAFYGKLFREGPERQLGDVLVAVTEYTGYLPPPEGPKVVTARGCAFDSRTIAVVFGQRIEVLNRSGETFIPRLVGAEQPALLVAMPGGDPVKLYPLHVGQFELADQTHAFAKADVFVLKYPTATVTGIDGKFEIKDIPASASVLVTAYLPATQGRVSQRVKIVAGEASTVDLTIPYEPAAAAPSAAPAPSATP